MVIHDKAKWHLEGDFPKDFRSYQGFVHIGFYLGWAIERNFVSELLTEDFPEELEQFRSGKITVTRLLQITDGVLDDQMLSKERNRFTADYYDGNDHGYYSPCMV